MGRWWSVFAAKMTDGISISPNEHTAHDFVSRGEAKYTFCVYEDYWMMPPRDRGKWQIYEVNDINDIPFAKDLIQSKRGISSKESTLKISYMDLERDPSGNIIRVVMVYDPGYDLKEISFLDYASDLRRTCLRVSRKVLPHYAYSNPEILEHAMIYDKSGHEIYNFFIIDMK